jgi:hypothetical protein
MRTTPCTLNCQADETFKNDKSEPVSSMIMEPTAAQIDETMPPKNSPSPTMTAAIDTSVYWVPMFASDGLRPVIAKPAQTPDAPAIP